MPSSLWSAEAGASNRVSHLLIALFFVVFCAFPAWGASCPPPANKDEELLARYVFELRNNRQTTCPPGGDFFIDPDEINYAVSSFCRTVSTKVSQLCVFQYACVLVGFMGLGFHLAGHALPLVN